MPEPGSPGWIERVQKLIREELKQPERLYYMSFAYEKEKGGFQGAIIIEARGPTLALRNAHLLGIAPGGQVMTVEVPDNVPAPPLSFRNRLLSKRDIAELWGDAKTLAELEAEDRANR